MTISIQRNFAGGEISPDLYARVDTVKYSTGVKTMRNGMTMRHGGFTNRPGFKFVGEVSDSTKTVRLIPFIFNSSQTYMLEFGNLYLRVIKAGAYVTETPQSISAVTNANPCVLTYVGADTYANGDEITITGVVGPLGDYLNGRNFKISAVNTGANTFQLNYMSGTAVDSTAFGAWTSGGTVAKIYTVTTTYATADLPTLYYAQSADILTITHQSYPPRDIARTGDAAWTIIDGTFAPTIAAPVGVTNTGGVGAGYSWVVTAIDSTTGEESLASSITNSVTNPAVTPLSINWTAVAGASQYNVYRSLNGVYGFIGAAGSNTFNDGGALADATNTPPSARNPFSGATLYPAVVSYSQQRKAYANSATYPTRVWMSRISQFKNFTISAPLQADDAITFSIAGTQVNEVKHLLDLGRFASFTSAGEWSIEGDTNGVISPTTVNPKQYSYNGASSLRPIVINRSAVYVQARGSIVRDLEIYQYDGYKGDDLTAFAPHLFEGHTIVDWAYQKTPHSIIWAVRDDGVLLGLTYVKEQVILAWHRHDLDGTFENVCVVPEGTEDVLYAVIKRTVNGRTVRYVEKMASRYFADIRDSIFMDASLGYDGRNTGATTMTLSGSGWTYADTLTLTASASQFVTTEVGNQYFLTGSDGTVIRFTVTGYTSATVVTGTPHKTVPVTMQGAATTTWTKAIQTVGGLWHLEGKNVSVLGDGLVAASPYNSSYTTVTVSSGKVTLDKPYGVIRVGLPYLTDLETLDLDTTQSETLIDKKILVEAVDVKLRNSRGLWAGPQAPSNDAVNALENLNELKIRKDETMDSPTAVYTGNEEIIIGGNYDSNGRVFLRQIDPVPLTILAVAPSGKAPLNNGR